MNLDTLEQMLRSGDFSVGSFAGPLAVGGSYEPSDALIIFGLRDELAVRDEILRAYIARLAKVLPNEVE